MVSSAAAWEGRVGWMAQLKYSLNIKRATTPFWQNAHMSHMVSVLYCHTMSYNVTQLLVCATCQFYIITQCCIGLLLYSVVVLCFFAISKFATSITSQIYVYTHFTFIITSWSRHSPSLMISWVSGGERVTHSHVSHILLGNCLRLVGFPNPLATGSDIHNSWGTWLETVWCLGLLCSCVSEG